MLNVDRPIRIRASERDDTVLAEIVRLIISEEFGPKVELTAHEEKVLMSGQIPTVGEGLAIFPRFSCLQSSECLAEDRCLHCPQIV